MTDIRDAEAVRKKIAQLCSERCSCDLKLGEEIFTSIFLSAGDDYFHTDIMMPAFGNELLKPGGEAFIRYIDRAVPFSMACRFIRREMQEGFDALRFEMPAEIRYGNRRGFFRVEPATSRPLRIVIDFGQSQYADEKIKDISGSGVSVASSISRYIGTGQKVQSIEIEMPDGSWVICSGVVRRVSGTILGIELEDVAPTDRTKLYRYVSERQQEIIANRKMKS